MVQKIFSSAALAAFVMLGCMTQAQAATVHLFGSQTQATSTALAGSASFDGTDPIGSTWSDTSVLITPPPTSISGVYKSPFDSVTSPDLTDQTYFSVGGSFGNEGAPSPVTLDFNATKTEFVLFWGSIDSYNTIEFLNGGSSVFQYTGGQLALNLGLTPAINYEYVALVGFSALEYDQVKFYSEGSGGNDIAAFEFALPTSGQAVVPLPAGLILLFSGLLGLGFLGRFKNKTAVS